jgi:ComF family protein
MSSVLERASRLALDLLFPPQCALCRTGGELLCAFCAATLPLAGGPRCDRCWDDIQSGSMCPQCLASQLAFTSVRAPFTHDAGARQLVHLLKYENLTSLAEPMARLMVGACHPTRIDLVVPVPLHRGRERSRGYNQAVLLARHLARDMRVEIDPRASRRVRATKPLAHSMSRDERRDIVRGAFSARRERTEGRRILLIDDVVTTGATLNACATALLEVGALEVHALAFVRA